MTDTPEPYLYDRSGRRYPISVPRWRGDDGSPLMLSPLPGIGRDDVDRSTRSQWRYVAAVPGEIRPEISLGEGCTPLLPARVGELGVHVKAEWCNPTGSFKDRGTSMMVSLLREQGVRRIVEDSSGNAGSSVAAYAAAAGLQAKILVPEGTSGAKVLQSRAFGAEIEVVPGSRADTAAEAMRQAGETFYASHNWHPYFLQGTKLLAYEIWEDLGFAAPDAVVVPTGAGSVVLGLSLGFEELRSAGQIDRFPRILSAQPANCSPLARAFAMGMPVAADGDWTKTLAEGTSIGSPVRDREVLAAVAGSSGGFQAVEEREIVSATRELVAQGFYTEPTSATAAAALPGFAQQGLLGARDTIVVILTGSGVKAAEQMAQVFLH